MGINNCTQLQLVNEGIEYVDDLGEFTNDDLDQIVKNLRQPGSTLDATTNALVPTASLGKLLNPIRGGLSLRKWFKHGKH